MKIIIDIIVIGLGLIYLPISLYGGWLLYNHVKATELMWFIWWTSVPIWIAVTVLSGIVKTLRDKEGD